MAALRIFLYKNFDVRDAGLLSSGLCLYFNVSCTFPVDISIVKKKKKELIDDGSRKVRCF